jgi:uncharacterized protein
MELRLEKYPSVYRIGSFVDNAVVIGGVRHTTSLIVTPEKVVPGWPPQHPDQLTVENLGMILALDSEVILVGTGTALRFPDSSILKGVIRAGIGIDFMDSRAVCRTYNILAAEGRNVAAGIIIDRLTTTD